MRKKQWKNIRTKVIEESQVCQDKLDKKLDKKLEM